MPDVKRVTYALNPLWEKYGLCHSPKPNKEWWGMGCMEDINRYYDLVEYCHDQVAFYWEKFPEEWIKKLNRVPGCGYFDVCRKVAPEQLDEASALMEEYEVRKQWWAEFCDSKSKVLQPGGMSGG